MKKILFFIVLSFQFVLAKTNPLIAPTITISELNFDAGGNWKLELEYIAANQVSLPFDSIFISSQTKCAKVKNYQIIGESGFIVLTTDSLSSDININSEGDSITVHYYIGNGFHNQKDILIFGNYANSMLRKPKVGQSIVSFVPNYGGMEYNHYSLSKTPSIGIQNSESDMYGTLKGFVYDKNLNLLKKRVLYFYSDNSFGVTNITTDSLGHFSTNIYSFQHSISKIQIKDINSSQITDANITTLSFWMDPDSVKEMDIYILDYTAVMIKNLTSSNNLIKLYPTIVNQYSILNYEIALPVKSSNCIIEIIDWSGRLIITYKIRDTKGIIHLPEQLHQGVFLVNFRVNNKMYKTSRILISNK